VRLYKVYKSVLTEGNVEKCVTLFGNELFGDELGGTEKNTPIENRYSDEISDFTDNMYGEELKPEFMNMIKTLKGCMGQYSEVLIPEETRVFRGTMIPLKYFVKNKEIINLEGGGNKYNYKAKSKVQSWTVNHQIANKFGDNSQLNRYAKQINVDDYDSPIKRKELLNDLISENLYLGFRLTYNTTINDFLFKSKYLNRLSHNGDEDEIIRVTNGPIIVDAYLKTGVGTDFNGLSFNLIKLINLAILGK